MSASEPSNSHKPKAEYQRRLDEAEGTFQRLNTRDSRLATLRWLSFVAMIALLGLGAKGYVESWLVIPAFLLFAIAVIVHGRCRRQRDLSQRRFELYETGVARLNDQWSGTRSSGVQYRNPGHVYTDDLDLFGDGSLFQLICWAQTPAGHDRLAAWLRTPAEKPRVEERQAAVSELRDNLNLREQLALLDADVSEDLNQDQLKHWASQPAEPVPTGIRIVAYILTVLSLLAIAGWMFAGIGITPLIMVLLIQIPFLFFQQRRIARVVDGMDDAQEGLDILSKVLDLIEERQFKSEFLNHVGRRLEIDGKPPSQTVNYLAKRVGYLNNSMRNQFFLPIGIVLCLPIHLAHSIELWRSAVGRHIDTWLDAVGDFEAIVSLGGYAYEHPDYVFPTISDDKTTFRGEQIGHPLLPASQCIRNSVSLTSDDRLMLISGSNMSGKSTLLRTVGTNTVLALAGAPVNAKSMEVSCMQVGTAMRVSDSLQEGKSLFFAVLGRLKSVVDLADKELPLLFLLDEILQGTNSHDRRIGAEAVIRSLVDRNAIGMVTTHDLALTEIGTNIPGTENVHFADTLKDGEMTFDYNLRPGVVKKSNAIELMRLVGLDV
jgi:Flp pilus assembly protein TadB